MSRPASGFTMIEMLTVVAILAILAAVAGPNMANMIRTQRIKTASFDIFSSLNFARSEAIKRNVSVTIAPVSGSWTNGWTVTDANANSLRVQGPVTNNVSVTGPASVVYSGSGRLSAAAMPQFALTAADVPTSNQRCIKVDLSGRPVSYQGACP
jgi:type IV fimbrial biogenesis protein FimT